jgi:hypothetical protein
VTGMEVVLVVLEKEEEGAVDLCTKAGRMTLS